MSRSDRTKPFHRLRIENAFNIVASKAVLLEWEMEPWFVEMGPWSFEVLRTQRDDFTGWVSVDIVTNQGYAYDTDRTVYTLNRGNYYKVLVTTGDGNTYESDVVQAGNNLDRRDWRLLKEIIRKETLALTKFTGARGWLLPYPKFGEPSANTDPNTGESVVSQDPDDSGTGVIGGYWGPVSTYVDLNPEKRITRVTDKGKVSAIVRTGVMLAFPRPSPRDVWVNGMTDERYTIGSEITVAASMRGIPIKVNVQLELVEPGNVIYSVPVPMQV